ncbi:39S ribosomal protein L18, mitochondrial [Strongylocentrotus purpuratus]|uniref:Large ribosomal subunit protein uL18m n=1 Tax=Strongylocentrotus purpuratus TaxID=7668 RepID=A0A7M7P6Z6_STRPU|nr:39S ribosomal protein L18, mitochondrial [Strongylocentrotus purpuratus]
MGSIKTLQTLLWTGLENGLQAKMARREFLSFRKILGMTMPATSCRCLHASQANLNSTTPPLQQTHAEQSEEENVSEQLSENDRVNPHFINRNPRNLELMTVARKDKGWSQSYPRKDYWHKLFVTKTNRHISARIEHIKGDIVVQASTKEWAIKKHLYSTSDVSASENLGRVLADRCLESGINFVHNSMKKTDKEQEGMAVFLGALEEGGLVLGEPRSIVDFRRPINYFPEVD